MSYSVFVICTRIVQLISGCGTVAGWHGEHESGPDYLHGKKC